MVKDISRSKESTKRLSLSAKCAVGGLSFLLAMGAIPVAHQATLEAQALEENAALEEAAVLDETAAEEAPVEESSYAGKDVVDRYLAGTTPTYDELLTIDFVALTGISPDLSAELKALMAELAPADPDPVPDPTPDPAPGDGDVDSGPGIPAGPDDPTVSVPEEPSAPEAPEVPEAPVSPGPEEVGQPTEDSSDLSALYPAWSYEGDTSFTMTHYTEDLTTAKFIAAVGEQARQVAQDHDLYASVMIAQAVIESESGTASQAETPNNNLFNIKGSADGVYRTYDTMMDSLEDHAQQLTSEDAVRSGAPTKANAVTWEQAVQLIGTARSLDEGYIARIKQLVADYDLVRYDAPLPYELTRSLTVDVTDPETGDTVAEERTLADLMAEATSHLGTRYLWGGTDPDVGLDCSGFVQLAYREALGWQLPRTTYYQCTQGEDVDFADLHMGDLLFFIDDHNTVGHVGMYLADGYYIESTTRTGCNAITSLEADPPAFAKRLISTQPVDQASAGSRA